MKKKNGFTLVELLVTIAIMISILTIAIVSITKISEGIKKQSYESVKSQVITAAEEYLSTNSYYIDTINGGSNVQISVGELVSNDYLNPVTNPITGKRINECSYVEIKQDKKKKSGLSYTFSENDGECPANNFVTVKPGIVIGDLEIEPIGTKGNEDWYKRNPEYEESTINESGSENNNSLNITADNVHEYTPGVAVKLTASVDNSNYYIGTITASDVDESTNDWIVYDSLTSTEQANEIIAYDIKSYKNSTTKVGKSVKYTVSYFNNDDPKDIIKISKQINDVKVDVDPPSCSVKVIGGTITNGNNTNYYCYELDWFGWFSVCPSAYISNSEVGSGIDSTKTITNNNGESVSNDLSLYMLAHREDDNTNIERQLFDIAGNKGNCSWSGEILVANLVSDIIDVIKKLIEDNVKYCGNTIGESTTWRKGKVQITQKYVNVNGEDLDEDISKTFSDSTETDRICNGLTTCCTVNVYVDNDPPYFTKDKSHVYLTQWDNNGRLLGKREIKLSGEDGNYSADVCLINISAGRFSITGMNPYARDDHSGINKSTFKAVKSGPGGCLIKPPNTNNPCTYTYTYYANDNVGNRGKIATYTFRVGYIENDQILNRNYDSFCNIHGPINKNNYKKYLNK